MLTACIDHGRRGDRQGYAQTHGTRLHRKVYAAKLGVALADIAGVTVRHTCDNTRCINPEHLVGGTMADNNRDRAERGRSAKVVPSRQCLSAEECAAIVARYNPNRVGKAAPNGVTALAEDYKVDRKVIYNVLKGAHVNAPGIKA